MAKKKEETVVLSPFTERKMIVKIVGDSELVLCKKARSYELEEIFRQSHPKGTKIPAKYQQDYNLWEKLITSVHWENPIEYHDDYSEYTEKEWEKLMTENRPCILAKAFQESIKEAFVSCGFRDSTGKNGTDVRRTVSFKNKTPITFAQYAYDQHLAQTSGLSRTNVLTQQNVFSGWKAEIEISYLESAFPKETILELINCAGKFIGIGSRRGEGYGRYHIDEIVA